MCFHNITFWSWIKIKEATKFVLYKKLELNTNQSFDMIEMTIILNNISEFQCD